MSLDTIMPLVHQKTNGAEALGNTLRFDFEEGCLHLDGTGATNIVSTEKKDADCTVNVSLDDFKQLLTGDLNPMAAVMSGKVRISGDMGVAMKLPAIFNG
jgi:acyl-CoA dehydrogenase